MWYKYNKIIGEILALGFYCVTMLYMDKGKTVFSPYFERGKQMTNAKKTQTAEVINVTTPASIVVDLSKARDALVKEAKKTGDVINTYAKGLEAAFDLVDNSGAVTSKWYELKGKLKAGVNAERKLFVAAFESAGFEKGTIDVYWSRVKKASGYIPSGGTRVSGSTDIDEKTKTELATIINRIFKHEENDGIDDCKASEAKRHLMTAYEILGGNPMELGTK